MLLGCWVGVLDKRVITMGLYCGGFKRRSLILLRICSERVCNPAALIWNTTLPKKLSSLLLWDLALFLLDCLWLAGIHRMWPWNILYLRRQSGDLPKWVNVDAPYPSCSFTMKNKMTWHFVFTIPTISTEREFCLAKYLTLSRTSQPECNLSCDVCLQATKNHWLYYIWGFCITLLPTNHSRDYLMKFKDRVCRNFCHCL